MDFELLEKHPWWTVGIIGGGGILLYLIFHRGSSAQQASTGTQYAAAGVDPQTAALQAQLSAQQNQSQAYISGLQLQGATQVSLAQIGADVSKFTTSATAETVDTQTAGQVAVALGTQNAVVQQAQINADVSKAYIAAIVQAFTGNTNPSVSTPPVSTPTPNSPVPTSQNLPPVQVNPQIVYGSGPGGPLQTGNPAPGTAVPGGIIPGGTQLVPSPSFANCDPRDTACVMNNQTLGINWQNATLKANTTNNFNQCMANANLSVNAPNYNALVAACHSDYGM